MCACCTEPDVKNRAGRRQGLQICGAHGLLSSYASSESESARAHTRRPMLRHMFSAHPQTTAKRRTRSSWCDLACAAAHPESPAYSVILASQAEAKGIAIVSESFLKACESTGRLVDPTAHLVSRVAPLAAAAKHATPASQNKAIAKEVRWYWAVRYAHAPSCCSDLSLKRVTGAVRANLRMTRSMVIRCAICFHLAT